MTKTKKQTGGIKSRIKEKTISKNKDRYAGAGAGAGESSVIPVREWKQMGEQTKNQTLLRIWSVI